MANFENNLSKGNVVRQLVKFSIPFLISNLIQTLYSVVDMVVVGRFAGTICMSGVNIGSQITFVVTNMVMGLAIGATVLVGQYLGAGDKKAMKETIGTCFSTLMILAVFLTVVMLVLTKPILTLIQTPKDAYDDAESYFIVTMLGTVFIFGYNALSAVMRGLGDSKNPLIFVAIACVVNIVLDIVFVANGMRAFGAALATVISQAISMILCVFYLIKNKFIFDFKRSSFAIKKDRLLALLRVGVPTSIQNVVVGMSFLFLTSLVNTMGSTASAAAGAVAKINGFAILPAVAMSSSVSAMVAHNLGAGEEKRAVKTMKTGMVMTFIMSALVFAICKIFPAPIMSLFGSDPEMISCGVDYIRTYAYDYLIVPFLFCYNGLFIGSGHSLYATISALTSSVLFRVPACYLFGIVLNMKLTGIGLGAPIASIAGLVLGTIFFLSGGWKKGILEKALQNKN